MAGSLSVDEVKVLLQYLDYASRFPDFPKNFVPPKLTDPTYVPPDKGAQLLIPTYITLVLAVIVVVVRMWVRGFWNGNNIGWDDWTMVMAMVAGMGISAVHILLVKIGGVGRHIYDLPTDMIKASQELAFADVQVYIVCVFLIKISICLFIKRLIAGSYPGPSKLADMLMVFFAAICVLSVFLIFFACSPVATGWNILLRISHPYKCLDMTKVIRGLNVIYSVGDWMLLILPIYIVWKLHLTRERRIAISCVLGLGGVACAISIVRLFFVQGVYSSFDPTWNGVLACIWNQLEVTLGIITGSLPALSVFLVRALDMLGAALSSSGSAIVSSLQAFRRGKSASWETEAEKFEQHSSIDETGYSQRVGPRDPSRVVHIKRDTFFEYSVTAATEENSPNMGQTRPKGTSKSTAQSFFKSKTANSSESSLPSLPRHSSDETFSTSTDWDLIIQSP